MAQIEVVVLDGDSDEFINQNILSQRDGKRPLIIGNDLKLHLKNGVGFIKSLSFTDNSSWVGSKQFRLGLRIVNEKILGKFSRIKEAVSQKFRVLDHRGEANKKHHPPQREDDVWRLEGIRRNGVYHKILTSQGIKTVDDLLKTNLEKGPLYLTKLLSKNVSNKM
ncbi:calmodulin-binding protein 60 B-like isoform X2 [Benincasa hispida]|uniref:calmodulin-binding protein 60 B-like isoform X2 n=1 Tax=Benincasa hispida TaxID=102211 RepID=UPI001902B868|nr:calmodulin-binding protein 60 B-like isoform X2 [Benincasa hispida]